MFKGFQYWWLNVVLYVLAQYVSNHGIAYAVTHGQNLIWAQKSQAGIARIVGIPGDPSDWVRNKKASTRYITAPDTDWHFMALSHDYRKQMLFWSDRGNKKIQGLNLNGTTHAFTIFGGISSEVQGLAVDWLSESIYWTDSVYNWIIVAPARQSNGAYRVLFDTDLDAPMGIAVYPQKGLLFWSDRGSVGRIEKASLAGENRQVVVRHNVVSPGAVAIDFTTDRLFWIDGAKGTLESIDFNGDYRDVIHTATGTNYHGMALYKNYMFVTDQGLKQLRIFETTEKKNVLNFNLGAIPYSVIMYHDYIQPNGSTPCINKGCQDICVSTADGYGRCLCTNGFVLGADGKKCQDNGRFGSPQLLYSIGTALCRFPSNLADMSMKNITLDNQCFLKGRKNVVAIGFNVHQEMLYYADNDTKTISRVRLANGHAPQVIAGGLGGVGGIAVDWITNNMYWTDIELNHIIVANLDGRNQHVLMSEETVRPIAIAVDAVTRKLYWSETGLEPRICVSFLDGSNKSVLVDSEVGKVNGITLDLASRRLFWSDATYGRIESIDFDGANRRRVIMSAGSDLHGLVVFKDYLLWTDQGDKNGLHIAVKTTGEKVRGVIHPNVGVAFDVKAYDPLHQPLQKGPCDDNKGGCDHLCLPNPNGFTCACANGFKLEEDGKCIAEVVEDSFVIFTDTFQKQIFQMSLKNMSVRAIPVSGHQNPIALDYDPVTGMVYWTDVMAKVIKRAFLNGSGEEVVQEMSAESVMDGIAVDHLSRLLYYTDTGSNSIGVMTLDGLYHTTLINESLDEPRSIVLDPVHGHMYWTDWGEEPKLERSNMDGSRRVTIIKFESGSWPNGLAVDLKDARIYWADARFDKIRTSNLFGQDIRTLVEDETAHYFGLAVAGRFIYYTDWTKKTIMKIDKNGGNSPIPIGPPLFSRPNDILAYRKEDQTEGKNECSDYNGFCSHLCLPVLGGKRCACPEGMSLKIDGFHCQNGHDNSAPSTTPSTTRSSTTVSTVTTATRSTTAYAVINGNLPQHNQTSEITDNSSIVGKLHGLGPPPRKPTTEKRPIPTPSTTVKRGPVISDNQSGGNTKIEKHIPAFTVRTARPTRKTTHRTTITTTVRNPSTKVRKFSPKGSSTAKPISPKHTTPKHIQTTSQTTKQLSATPSKSIPKTTSTRYFPSIPQTSPALTSTTTFIPTTVTSTTTKSATKVTTPSTLLTAITTLSTPTIKSTLNERTLKTTHKHRTSTRKSTKSTTSTKYTPKPTTSKVTGQSTLTNRNTRYTTTTILKRTAKESSTYKRQTTLSTTQRTQKSVTTFTPSTKTSQKPTPTTTFTTVRTPPTFTPYTQPKKPSPHWVKTTTPQHRNTKVTTIFRSKATTPRSLSSASDSSSSSSTVTTVSPKRTTTPSRYTKRTPDRGEGNKERSTTVQLTRETVIERTTVITPAENANSSAGNSTGSGRRGGNSAGIIAAVVVSCILVVVFVIICAFCIHRKREPKERKHHALYMNRSNFNDTLGREVIEMPAKEQPRPYLPPPPPPAPKQFIHHHSEPEENNHDVFTISHHAHNSHHHHNNGIENPSFSRPSSVATVYTEVATDGAITPDPEDRPHLSFSTFRTSATHC